MTMWLPRRRKQGKKFTWLEFMEFVWRRTFNFPKVIQTASSKDEACYLGPRSRTSSGKPHSSRTLGTLQQLLRHLGGLAYGCLPGNDVKLADAIQAYIQAKLTGPPFWVELPDDAWPDDINFRKFRRPVVRLVKALYGHPDSGMM